jgi:hypothetical protein
MITFTIYIVKLFTSGRNKIQKHFSNTGNIFLLCRVYKAYNQIEGECTMDDLKFDSSALLIVGMLIGVVYALL